MKRPYTPRNFAKLIKKVRKFIPDIAITTDVLLGFPGEDGKSFKETLKFIEQIAPSRMHVFSYSKREGTAAAKSKHSADEKKVKERAKFLVNLSNGFSMDFAHQFIGQKQNAIIESQRDKRTGLLCGYTDRYIRILLDGPDNLKNQLLPVTIDHLDRYKYFVFAIL